ncbi:18678_t:CDS:2, partial [Funneliformis geosporum]
NDSIPDFLAKLRLYLQNQDVDLADNVGGPLTRREVAIYLRGSFDQPGTVIIKLRVVEDSWNKDWRIA